MSVVLLASLVVLQLWCLVLSSVKILATQQAVADTFRENFYGTYNDFAVLFCTQDITLRAWMENSVWWCYFSVLPYGRKSHRYFRGWSNLRGGADLRADLNEGENAGRICNK